MAVIYYPKNQLMYIRDTTVSASNFESIVLNVSPNTVLYFDTSSLIQTVNATQIPITASWALTSSLSIITSVEVSASWASSSYTASYIDFPIVTASYASASTTCESASYTVTASFALNGGGGGSTTASAYMTITTASNWITVSFLDSEEWVNITAAALYNFTCSNVASSSQVMSTTLFINNTATATSSMAFPSDWVFIGNAITSLSRSAVLSLRNYGGVKTVASLGFQF